MIADSLSGVHIPLPAVRPRQRSWGTSLPQSVILICCFCVTLRSTASSDYALLHRERKAQRRNGLRFWSSGSCPTMMDRCKPSPMFGDFPAFLTLVVCKPQRGPIITFVRPLVSLGATAGYLPPR